MSKFKFNQADVKRALKAANDLGYNVHSYEITFDGSIKVTIGDNENQKLNEWDSANHYFTKAIEKIKIKQSLFILSSALWH